jgi:hypothetical protein
MVKSAFESMVKILKLPLLASMISEEAPKPVLVRVPAALASAMLSRAVVRVMG